MTAPVPPVSGDSWRQWAQQVRAWLQRTRSILERYTSASRASEDGVILWDQDNGYPVVSLDGSFRQIVLADGYAFFGQDDDVTAALADTAYAITFDAPAMADGVALGTPASRIVFTEGGTYMLAFSAQVSSTSASTVEFRFWPRINGVDVSGSTIRANLHQNDASFVVSRSAVFQLSAGDYLEAMWAVSNTAGHLEAAPATAYAPSAPSTTLSVTRIRA